jgi:hypothetical protein
MTFLILSGLVSAAKKHRFTLAVCAALVLGANPALAQVDVSVESSFGLGAELRYYSANVEVRTDFNGNVERHTVGVNSIDPGIDAYFTFPVHPENGGSFVGSVWSAPTAQIDVRTDQANGGDTALTHFEYKPNIVSGFIGYEQDVYRDGIFSISGRAYVGGRLSSWDLRVEGNGGGGGTPYDYTDSGTAFVPAGGLDVRFEWDQNPLAGHDCEWALGLYGGLQVQGGYDLSAAASNVNVSSHLDVGTGLTAYGGVSLRVSF